MTFTKEQIAATESEVTLTLKAPIAIITLNRPKQLNALTQPHYYRLSNLLRQVAALDNIYVTVITGTGRYFSAGADVRVPRASGDDVPPEVFRRDMMSFFGANNLDVTRSFYQHPKILIAALNGPTVGLSAALLGFVDFCYVAPHAFLLTPFSSLGLVTEGGASIGLVQRLGLPLANEALLMSRKITAERLLQSGFATKIISGKDANDSAGFLEKVLEEVEDKLGDHLVPESLIGIKKLIRAPFDEAIEAQGVREIYAGMATMLKGIPQREFAKIASGQKKHKL